MDWKERISWIDGYAAEIKPYFRVRRDDNLLIKIPNQAYKLNAQGVKLLEHAFSGRSVLEIPPKFPDPEKVASDIYAFFSGLAALMKGNYSEALGHGGIEKVSFSLPYNTLPVLSEIALTYRCNLACRFCYAACGCRRDPSAEELSAADLVRLLRIIAAEAQVPSVSFTGGEPCLRPELPELAAEAKKLGMWTNLITNGTLVTPELARRLKEAGLDSAQVSLEAGTAELHDMITDRPGAFEACLAGARNLLAAGVRTHTNTTVSALNRAALAPLLDRVKELGTGKFSMNMLMPVGSADGNMAETFISYSEIGEAVKEAARLAEERGLEFMWYSPTPMCVFNPVPLGLGNKGCAACDGLLSSAPNGDLLPCSSYPEPLGNLLEYEGRFRDLWEAERPAWFRRKGFAHGLCGGCADLPLCNGGCPLYWAKAGHAELEKAAPAYIEGGRDAAVPAA
ncbi:MAG: radical SAM protein [Elusimicrobiales bacterium]|nr:radical SAM protein [Elusimicrobiales bacterium]